MQTTLPQDTTVDAKTGSIDNIPFELRDNNPFKDDVEAQKSSGALTKFDVIDNKANIAK
jgi:hypothetical protein